MTLGDYLACRENIVFFGGAGVSTESGIPDFRSEDGLYSALEVYGQRPETLLSRSFFRSDPETFFRYYKENLLVADVQPNAAHRALAWLEASGRLRAVITQNIDGLHQAAGSGAVYELHGSNMRHYCVQCGREYALDYILDEAHCEGHIPKCADCGGIVRPDVVLYEEALPEETVQKAIAALREADMLIVGGTSLTVYPAAGMIEYFAGKPLVLINKTPTPYDARADIVMHDSLGAVLGGAVDALLD